MKKRFLQFFILVNILSTVFAQNREIRMNVKGEKSNAVYISELKVDVNVTGNIATTTFDMVFKNTTDRILEGEFEFPLSEGQTVSGFALDINGKLRNGVVVEKQKGREVFEDVVRKNVDPGLVEVTKGNNFKTRVYPLPAKGTRRVSISYEQELNIENNKRRYLLNSFPKQKFEKFDFNINVFKEKTKNSSLKIANWNSGYNASISEKNFVLNEPVVLDIPDESSSDSYIETTGKDTFFYCYKPVKNESRNKKLPKSVTVVFDVSSSSKDRNVNSELKLLKSYLSKLENPSVDTVTFAHEIIERKSFGKDIDEAVKYLSAQKFDGGTSLGAIDFSMFRSDEILLFSDGLSNWKNGMPTKGKNVVNVINSSYSADHSLLKAVAEENLGIYINLSSLSEKDALDLLCHESLRIINVDYDSKKISEVYPMPGTTLSKDLSISGILRKKEGKVKVSIGYGNKVTEVIEFDISGTDGTEASNVKRLWAQKKIDALTVFYDKNRDEIMNMAKTYGIVTKDTSLIVLDSVYDYVRYGITPPDDLLDEYNRIVKNQPKTVQKNEVPSRVYRYFESFKAWWKKDTKEFAKKKKESSKEPDRSRVMERNLSDSHLPPRSDLAMNDEMMLEPEVMEERVMLEKAGADSTENGASDSGAVISMQAWSPDAEYLTVLKKTNSSKMYDKYLELKASYSNSPSFYMDVSDYFFEEDLPKEALRILTNLAELELENSDVLRALGNKLIENELYEEAVFVFEELTVLRPEIPQFFRDLALAYNLSGEKQKAVDTLYYVVCHDWDSRFDEIQMIALNDMNSIIATAKKGSIDVSNIDKKLMENFPVDVRVILTWNTDNCDIDLWVTDPNGEKCFYSNKLTNIGGRISRDFTQGYGPEEFCIKKAPKGKYKIEVNYYGSSSQKLLQPVTVQAEVYTNFGKKNQQRKVLTLQLESVKSEFHVGTIEF